MRRKGLGEKRVLAGLTAALTASPVLQVRLQTRSWHFDTVRIEVR